MTWRTRTLLVVSLLIPMVCQGAQREPLAFAAVDHRRDAASIPRAELVFERNDGQHDASVRYVGRGGSYSVIFDGTDAALVFPSSDPTRPLPNARLRFAGSSGAYSVEPRAQLPSVSHFIRAAAQTTNVPNYAAVAYREIYPDIDAVFHASPTQDLEIDFVVAPGADPTAIGISVDGTWRLTPEGDVAVCTEAAEIRLRRPIAYQVINDRRVEVQAAFASDRADAVRFEIGAYDPAHPLIIDPVVSYATAIAKVYTISGIAVDKRQNAYVVGSATDAAFTTTPGAYDTTYSGHQDAVIIKYNKAGQRIFATFLGETGVFDEATGIAVDDTEAMYVTGTTSMGWDAQLNIPRFPVTPGAYQSFPYTPCSTWSIGSDDVFVTKFTPSGSTLAFSSIVAGSGIQRASSIALGPDGSVYVAGSVIAPASSAQCTQFPTTGGAYRTAISGDPTMFGNDDGFVFALNNSGSALVASTLFGGRAGDQTNALAVDHNGDVWLAGHTYSFDFSKTANAYRRIFIGPNVSCGTGCTFRLGDAFALKINKAMTQLLYGTFLPGSSPDDSDVAWDVATDSENNAYVVGSTLSDDFPTTPGAYKTANHGGFITKFNAAGQVQFSTVLGGVTPSNARTHIVGVRSSGDVVFVTGSTNATDFAMKGAIQSTNGGGTDMIISALNATGNLLEFSTYLGGTGGDSAGALALDEASNLYFVGGSSSPDFPYSQNAAEPPVSGGNTVYVKLSADRDEDGLLDWWELSGIDSNGDGTIDLNLASLGANVDHKDVFVEVDFMTAATHVHDPRTLPSGSPMSPTAIAPVVTAFANAPVANPDGNTGVTLHVLVDESLPEQALISVDGVNSDFNKIKLGVPHNPCGTAHFGTVADRSNATNCVNIIKAKRRVYRYALFAHRFAEVPGSTGIAEIGGNDFVVALEVQEPWHDYEDKANSAAMIYNTSLEIEWRDIVAGTFMHELGHTLGLFHGGGFGQLNTLSRAHNCKPNYLSVMNYTRQTNMEGTSPGTSAPKIRTNRMLNYSSSVLPTLSEGGLVEGNGVGGPAGVSIMYGEGTTRNPRITTASGAIDWNGINGIEATPVSADINKIQTIPLCDLLSSPNEVLEGHDDWSNLVYNFRLSGYYADGTSLPATELPELSDADVSGGLLGTVPPSVAITGPANEARFSAGVSIPITATASDAEGSIVQVHFVADSDLLSSDTTTPYAHTWSGAATGTHLIRANAVDDVGAAGSAQVTVHVGCMPSFTPSSANISYDAGGGTFDMSIAGGCRWTAVSSATWLAVTPADGDGPATLMYSAFNNTDAQARTATVTIGGQTFVITQDPSAPFGAPSGVLATGTVSGTPAVSVSWHGTAGVASYEVAFSSNGTSYTTAGATTEQFFDITDGITANTAYLVKVRAIATGGAQSPYSAIDLASTYSFTDQPEVGVTPAKAVHWGELRTAITAVRQLAGLATVTWTANIAPGEVITRQSLEELRAALDPARSALGLPAVPYADYPLPTPASIRATHIMQLRGGVE